MYEKNWARWAPHLQTERVICRSMKETGRAHFFSSFFPLLFIYFVLGVCNFARAKAIAHLDGKHVVFGELQTGINVLGRMKSVELLEPRSEGKPAPHQRVRAASVENLTYAPRFTFSRCRAEPFARSPAAVSHTCDLNGLSPTGGYRALRAAPGGWKKDAGRLRAVASPLGWRGIDPAPQSAGLAEFRFGIRLHDSAGGSTQEGTIWRCLRCCSRSHSAQINIQRYGCVGWRWRWRGSEL